MRLYADLHIHSRYSRATSKQLIPAHLDFWARAKGISILGTGDCIHPLWLELLEQELQPAEPGLYTVQPEARLPEAAHPFPLPEDSPTPLFCLTTEISTIFKRNGKVRKNHSLILLPSMEAAKGLQRQLQKTGNIHSDGRPILGLDVRNLLEIVLENDPGSILIPAHIWTPWFSMLGSRSGFDSLQECFEDLADQITAVETGLSSDPAMNWCCSFLDHLQLVSNSDAHSPEKLGRNATILNLKPPPSFQALSRALKTGEGLAGTVDLFPQEGKYHFDGHRKCGVRLSPLETLQRKGLCPECGNPVTRGVLYRVSELADRYDPLQAPDRRPWFPIIPLAELLSELYAKGPASKAIRSAYSDLISRLGPELPLLLDLSSEKLQAAGESTLAGMLERIRERRVRIQPGFDGEFGVIRTAARGELQASGPALFETELTVPDPQPLISFDISAFQQLTRNEKTVSAQKIAQPAAPGGYNPQQQEAIAHKSGPCRIIAGPGSGKTRVLSGIIQERIREGVEPEKILALSFSNRAARELAERVVDCGGVDVLTFHKLGLRILDEELSRTGRTVGFSLLTEEEVQELTTAQMPGKTLKALLSAKLLDIPFDAPEQAAAYEALLQTWNAFDLADLISTPLQLLREEESVRKNWQTRYDWILVDEAQDINRSQYELLKLLCKGHSPNLTIVGDPDQAIYGFRGADIRLMESFTTDFPQARTLYLSKSYRCPGNVLQAAAGILKRDGRDLSEGPGVRLTIRECATARSEAEWIARTIEKMLGGVRSFSRESGISDGEVASGISGLGDFAILCRTKAQFPALQEALENHGISSSPSVPDKEIDFAPLLRILRHSVNPDLPLPEKVARLLPEQQPLPARELLERLGEALPLEYNKSLAAMQARIEEGESTVSLLTRITLEQEQDRFDPRAEAVSLITIHAAKGLEFRTVFIPGCTRDLLPFSIFGKKEGESLAEEERLFYVGMTRTEEQLFLTWPRRLHLRGKVLQGGPSPFLARIRENLLTRDREEARSRSEDRQQELLF